MNWAGRERLTIVIGVVAILSLIYPITNVAADHYGGMDYETQHDHFVAYGEWRFTGSEWENSCIKVHHYERNAYYEVYWHYHDGITHRFLYEYTAGQITYIVQTGAERFNYCYT